MERWRLQVAAGGHCVTFLEKSDVIQAFQMQTNRYEQHQEFCISLMLLKPGIAVRHLTCLTVLIHLDLLPLCAQQKDDPLSPS